MKHFQIKKFMVIAAAAGFMLPGNAVFAKTAVLNGNLGEISSQINVPSKYAGYEATIIVEVERSSELGDLTSIRPLIYSVTSPSRTLYQCQANVYETSKTIAVSRTEAGVYTITGGGNTTGGTPCQGLATVKVAYMTIYGLPDDNGGNSGSTTTTSGGSTINNITITGGDDDGLYRLLNTLFGYVAEVQNIQAASDALIREDLARYVSQLQSELQNADAGVIATLQNQINTLSSVLSGTISDLRAALQSQIDTISSQVGALESAKDSMLSNFYSLKSELMIAISRNSDDIADLSRRLAENYDALISANAEQKSELLDKIAEVSAACAAADSNMIAEYTRQLAELESRLQMNDRELREAMEAYVAALESRMEIADERIRGELQAQLDGLTDGMNDCLRQLLHEYDDRIQRVTEQLSEVDSGAKTALQNQKAVLQEQLEQALRALHESFAAELSAETLSESERARIEAELQERIAATNLEYQKRILEIDSRLGRISGKTAAELLAELTWLRQERDLAEAALNSQDHRAKTSAIGRGAVRSVIETAAALEAKIRDLQEQLDSLNAVGDLTIEDLLAKIRAGDAENAAEMERMERALKTYCDNLKTELSREITATEGVIQKLQSELTRRMNTLEDRLKYAVKTDEDLLELQQAAQARVNVLANQIAALQLAMDERKANGGTTTDEENELGVLLLQYESAKTDLENIGYAIEIRSGSEFALHRKWIMELQEVTVALRRKISEQGEQISSQKELIDALTTQIANLETALRGEISALKQELITYVNGTRGDLEKKLADLESQVSTLRDNVVTLATSSYSSYGSSSVDGSSYNYSGASNRDTPEDRRDLRTSDSTRIDF